MLSPSGMALDPWGQIPLCSSLRSNWHKLKASGGVPRLKAFSSSVDFSSCFSWPKDDTRRDTDEGGGSRENSEDRTSWERG